MTKIKLVHLDTLSCEPIVRRMSDGSLLMVAQCGDTYEPAPGNREYYFHSYDNGETWSAPIKLMPENGMVTYCTEVAVYDDRVVAYMSLHNGQQLDWTTEVMVSRDCGHTWVSEGPVPGLETYTFVRSKITLSDGSILLPYHHYPVSAEENARLVEKYTGKYRTNGRLAYIGSTDVQIDHVDNGVLISRDGGLTFEKHTCPPFPIYGETGLKFVWSEPTIAELSDGRVAMLIRVTRDVLWYSESSDGGCTWSEFRPTDIPNPSCKPKLIPLPDGKIALIHAANSLQRTPLCLWISDDDMRTWRDKRIISDFPLTFDYPDGFYEDGTLHISVELQRRDVLYIEYTL